MTTWQLVGALFIFTIIVFRSDFCDRRTVYTLVHCIKNEDYKIEDSYWIEIGIVVGGGILYIADRQTHPTRHYIYSLRIKSGIFGQTVKFGQRPCLFYISNIRIKK